MDFERISGGIEKLCILVMCENGCRNTRVAQPYYHLNAILDETL